jgi:effector-binding domain-containing protein
MMTYEIISRDLAAQTTAVMRGEMPVTELGEWLAGTYRAVQEHLDRIGMHPVGPPFARFTFLGRVVAVEAGFPVAGEIAGDGGVEPSLLPCGLAAVTTHLGRYEDLEAAFDAVHDWLNAHGYMTAGPHWEVYFNDPNAEPDPSRWRTDVVVPYSIP